MILYDEHTWGAYNSITEPDVPFVKDQWKIKQAFALDGDAQSRKLLASALAGRGDRSGPRGYRRVQHLILAADRSGGAAEGHQRAPATSSPVPDGKPVRSQRLSTGELAFLAKDVPPWPAGDSRLWPA